MASKRLESISEVDNSLDYLCQKRSIAGSLFQLSSKKPDVDRHLRLLSLQLVVVEPLEAEFVRQQSGMLLKKGDAILEVSQNLRDKLPMQRL